MADNKEEDYLDSLLKSMSPDAEEKEPEPEETEEEKERKIIKEMVEEALSKSQEKNKNNLDFDDDYEDEFEELKDDEPEELPPSPEIVEQNARNKENNDNANAMSDEQRDREAEAALDKMLSETDTSEIRESLNNADKKDDEIEDASGLSSDELERLSNMGLDNIIEDVTSDKVSVEDLFGNGANNQSDDNAVNSSDTSAVNNIDSDVSADADNKADTSVSDNEDEISAQEAINSIFAEGSGDSQDGNTADESAESSSKENKSSKKSGKKDKPKKKGLLSVIKNIFFESVEEENLENVSLNESEDSHDFESDEEKEHLMNQQDEELDENEKLIKELYKDKENSDNEEAPKKGFFAKFKYRLKQFFKKQAEEDQAEQQAEEEEFKEKQKARTEKKEAAKIKKEQKKKEKPDKSKAKKEKKVAPKKPKKEKKPKEPPKPGDILKIKPLSVVLFVMFIAGIVVLIQVLNFSFNYNDKVSQAKAYYENEDYDKAYSKLNGLKLNGGDKTLYEQASVLMYVQRQYDSYQNYKKLNMNTEALNALIKGVSRYREYGTQAKELGVYEKMNAIYSAIISELQSAYKISETEAISIVNLSNDDFTAYYYKIKAYGETEK